MFEKIFFYEILMEQFDSNIDVSDYSLLPTVG